MEANSESDPYLCSESSVSGKSAIFRASVFRRSMGLLKNCIADIKPVGIWNIIIA